MILVIKVTKSCNLRCRYCYMDIDKSANIKIMDMNVVSALIEKFGAKYDNIDYSWHGGEPTLAGIGFYKQVLEKQKSFYKSRPNKSFKNSLQTNGVVFSEEWFKFLTENDFSFGFSYDGPESKDHNRVFITDRPAGPQIRDTLTRLKSQYNYAPGVICVITKNNIDAAKQIYEDFKAIGIKCFSILPYQGQKKELTINCEEFYNFHKEVFDLWLMDKDDNRIKEIIPFKDILTSLIGQPITICSWNGQCFRNLLTIIPNGDVFLCSSLYNPEHKIGNILVNSIDDMLASDSYQFALRQQDEVLSQCNECEVFDICKGGCRETAYHTYGRIDQKDPYCEGRRALVKYVLNRSIECFKKSSICT